jgi:hypothetical protein
MPLVIGRSVHVHFDEAEIGVVQVAGDPVGRYQNFGMRVFSHGKFLL